MLVTIGHPARAASLGAWTQHTGHTPNRLHAKEAGGGGPFSAMSGAIVRNPLPWNPPRDSGQLHPFSRIFACQATPTPPGDVRSWRDGPYGRNTSPAIKRPARRHPARHRTPSARIGPMAGRTGTGVPEAERATGALVGMRCDGPRDEPARMRRIAADLTFDRGARAPRSPGGPVSRAAGV